MELFPAQPDLSLQISPPNTKPSSAWRTTTHEDEMDLGFWKRALDNSSSRNSSMAKSDSNSFELSLANNPNRVSSNSDHPNINISNLIQSTNSSNLIHSFPHPHHQIHHHHLLHHHHQQNNNNNQAGLMSSELGFLRPIRGIPVYQNHLSSSSLDKLIVPSTTTSNTFSSTTTPAASFPSQNLMRSRILSRFPAKRSMRAPRMRWTTTLHARFVHAVELLGGHESK